MSKELENDKIEDIIEEVEETVEDAEKEVEETVEDVEEEAEETVEETVEEDDEEKVSFFEKNKKILIGILTAIVLIAAIVIALIMNGGKIIGDKRSGQFKLDLEDQVTSICDYNSVPVEIAADYEITDEARSEYLVSILRSIGAPAYKSNPDKEVVEAGDYVLVDYTGYKDGEAFGGGAATNILLDISANSVVDGTLLIDGFCDDLAGKKVGDTFRSAVTFPEEYPASPDLAGVEVEFEFTVKMIYTTEPMSVADLTDEFVNEYFAGFGFTTKDALLAQLNTDMEQTQYTQVVSEAKNYMLENSEVEIPEKYLEARLREYKDSFIHDNVPEGEEIGAFLESRYGVTLEKAEADWKQNLEYQIKSEFVFGLVAEREGIEVDEDVFADYVDYIINASGGTLATKEEVYDYFGAGNAEEGEEYLRQQYRVNKATDYVAEHAAISFK